MFHIKLEGKTARPRRFRERKKVIVSFAPYRKSIPPVDLTDNLFRPAIPVTPATLAIARVGTNESKTVRINKTHTKTVKVIK